MFNLKRTNHKPWDYRKDISGCGLSGLINTNGKRVSGEVITRSIRTQHDRGNGLGGGFAAYGIYPDFKDHYAVHVMCDSKTALNNFESFLKEVTVIDQQERIPTRASTTIRNAPLLMRYFVKPDLEADNPLFDKGMSEDDFMVRMVMKINLDVPGAFVFSSGRNMGAFKGVGYPEDIADFFRLDEYEGYIWTAHNRFPTNTPGWWGGAHPFTILDWSIVHNGEISSYGINKRYLEMFGYHCTLLTDTEVVAYLLDLLIRRHGLPIEIACLALAPPFWNEVNRMEPERKKLCEAIRMVYASALLNGPFAVLFAFNGGLVGLNDRIKLRPLIAAESGETVYMASEESAIREICPDPDKVWMPKAGEPVVVKLNKTE
ncbi:MAG TPA: glutamine amidotransferase family protein [Syntrophales bacterium]|nr:glutamine amidotransferase family protein [Syntrophales bacterium]